MNLHILRRTASAAELIIAGSIVERQPSTAAFVLSTRRPTNAQTGFLPFISGRWPARVTLHALVRARRDRRSHEVRASFRRVVLMISVGDQRLGKIFGCNRVEVLKVAAADNGVAPALPRCGSFVTSAT